MRLERHQREEGRHQRHIGGKGDEHGASGYDAKLREADEIGAGKGEEADGGGDGAKRERVADAARRFPQRRCIIGPSDNRLAVTQREMDAEIDAETDEQHGEADRYEVEVADRERREGGGPHQPHQKGRQRRQYQPRAAQSGEQQKGDEEDGDDGGVGGAPGGAQQFLVIQRHRAGEPDADALCRDQAQFAGKRPDARDGAGAEQQFALPLDRLDDDDAPAVAGVFGLPGHHFPPTEITGPALGLGLEGRGHGVEQPDQPAARLRPLGDLPGGFGQHLHQAAQAVIGDEFGQQRLGIGQPVGQGR